MWTEIKTEKDIEDFMKKTDICAEDESFEIIYMKYENHSLLLILECWLCRLEMFFEGVQYFNNFRLGKDYWDHCGRCYIEFRTDLLGKTRDDRLIVCTDNHKILNCENIFFNDTNGAVIVAYQMKYRITDRINNTMTESSLKNIVEENYLIEIAWDYFYANLDDYIKSESDEAEQYGITSRESVKPYFRCYGLKYFTETEETYIVLTIKFNDINNKYLGYYDIVFNTNLEIIDDFFVIE